MLVNEFNPDGVRSARLRHQIPYGDTTSCLFGQWVCEGTCPRLCCEGHRVESTMCFWRTSSNRRCVWGSSSWCPQRFWGTNPFWGVASYVLRFSFWRKSEKGSQLLWKIISTFFHLYAMCCSAMPQKLESSTLLQKHASISSSQVGAN